MKQYWRAGANALEIMANEGHDGEGRVPLKKLQIEYPDGGAVWIWAADNEDSEPTRVIAW